MAPQSGSSNGSWKNYVLAILTTALLTSSTGWFAFGRDTVRKDELQTLQSAVTSLTTSVNELTTAVAVLSERVRLKEGKAP